MKKIYLTSLLVLLLTTIASSQITATLSGCGANTFFFAGVDSTGRNFYHDGSGTYSIEYYSPMNEWVIVYLPGYSIGYSNTFNSLPDPPCYGTGSWNVVTPGCGDVTGLFGNCQSTLTGIENINNSTAIEIYPNPGYGDFNFSGVEKESWLEIYNATGSLCYHNRLTPGITTIHLNDLEKGIYFYQITNSEGERSKGKFILN